jgi:O-antigen ligase
MIGLLTFSRTGWIVFALQASVLAFVRYRDVIRKYLSTIIGVIICLIPLLLVMVQISASHVAESSNSTRLALLEIALDVFWTSPWIGGGAGTFLNRVGSSHIFRVEYGEPLDSHGFGQKLAAETGLFGLAAFALVLVEFFWFMIPRLRGLRDQEAYQATFFLLIAAGGSIVYQLFNTNYWTGKMWMPIGLALAAVNAFSDYERQRPEPEIEI